MKDCEYSDFQKMNRVAVVRYMVRLKRGNRAVQNSGKMNSPEKSDSLPVSQPWNRCLNKKSFSNSKPKPRRKPGETKMFKFFLSILITQQAAELLTMSHDAALYNFIVIIQPYTI